MNGGLTAQLLRSEHGASRFLTSVSKLGRQLMSKHKKLFSSKFITWSPKFIDKTLDWKFKEQWHHRNFSGLGYIWQNLELKIYFTGINQSSNFETAFSLLRSLRASHWVTVGTVVVKLFGQLGCVFKYFEMKKFKKCSVKSNWNPHF